MKCRRLFSTVFASAVFASLNVDSAFAATITLNAIQDTTLAHYSTNSLNTTVLNNQNIDVRGGSNSATNATAAKRYGMLEFDLSGVTDQIVGATLQLYMLPGTDIAANNGTTIASAVAFPLTAHLDEATLTWSGANGFTTRADLSPAEVALTNLGTFTFSDPGAVPTGAYYAGAAASASDAAFLETRRTALFPAVAFLLNSNSTSSVQWHQWANHESGFAAQLVLTVVPEPSSGVMALVGLSYCAFLVRRKKGAV
jgi:hypothetical protein